MRRLGRGLVLLVLVAIAALIGLRSAPDWAHWRGLRASRSAGLDERVLFEARANRPLRFNAATNQGWMALQGFVAAPYDTRERGLRLDVEIEIADGAGQALHRERRYLALRPASGAQPYGMLGPTGDVPVWILPTAWVELSAWPAARTVSVRVLSAPAGARGVLWRGGIEERLADAQTRLRFRRLGAAGRDALTEGWVTPPALVDPDLKRELVRYRLERIGPLGQPDQDFDPRSVLRRLPTPRLRQYAPRMGAIAIGPSMRVAFDNDAARDVTIDARANAAPLRTTLLRIDGRTAIPVAVFDGAWRGALAVGRYELRSDAAGDVDVRDVATGDPLVPDGRRPRMHPASPGQALDYALQPVAGAVPPLRIALRPAAAAARVGLVFSDAQGVALQRVDVDAPARPSAYDRRADRLDRAAFDATQIDLTPPAEATTLHVEPVDGVAFVAASTTLPGVRGAHRWFSFFPDIDPRSPASQGVVFVEQPRASDASATRAPSPTRTPAARDRRDAAPRLRLRPERDDSEG